MLNTLQLWGNPRQQRHQRVVNDDDAVFSVVDDVAELFGKEPQVERVQHCAHAGNSEVGFEVLLSIPQEGADAVAPAYAQSFQCGGEAFGAVADFGVTGAAAAVAHKG